MKTKITIKRYFQDYYDSYPSTIHALLYFKSTPSCLCCDSMPKLPKAYFLWSLQLFTNKFGNIKETTRQVRSVKNNTKNFSVLILYFCAKSFLTMIPQDYFYIFYYFSFLLICVYFVLLLGMQSFFFYWITMYISASEKLQKV